MAIYRERLNYGDMLKDTVEIGGSFIINGFTGRYVEDIVRPNVTPSSSTIDKILAGAANNVPKLVLYYILNTLKLRGAAAAAMGSVGFDVLIRASNSGVNPASIYISKYRVLSPELQNMESIPDWAERQKQFASMPTTPDVLERRRRFGSMILPDRPDLLTNRKYGAMPFQQNPEKTERQRRFGTMILPDRPDLLTNRKYGAMEEMGFKPELKTEEVKELFNMK